MGVRVVKIINSFRPLIGGGEQQAERLAKALAHRGNKITILTRHHDPSLPVEEVFEGVRLVRIGGHHRWGYALGMLQWLWRNRGQYDLVHAHQSHMPLVVASLAHRLWGVPTVCTPMNGHRELQWVTSSSGAIRRLMFSGTGAWISKSEDIAQVVRGLGKGQVYEIPNGIDTEAFAPDLNHSGAVPTVIFVGRLQRPKRVDELLTAWRHVTEPAKLLIVGDGPLIEEWQREAVKLNLARVKFLGKRDDVSDLLRTADVFVLPTDAEGMPNALLEAMSTGLACLATGVGAIPAMLADEAGLIISPTTDEGWAKSLNRVLSNEKLRHTLGVNARRKVLENYSLSTVAEQVEAVYLKLVSRDT